jgi:hypothetical protein
MYVHKTDPLFIYLFLILFLNVARDLQVETNGDVLQLGFQLHVSWLVYFLNPAL